MFERNRLLLQPLSDRKSLIDTGIIKDLYATDVKLRQLEQVAIELKKAKNKGSAIVLMMGAHVLRAGVQRYLIDMIENGDIDCIAMNGAGIIHDFELALIGKTTESVSTYIKDGQFGMWKETGKINDITIEASRMGIGLGAAVGKYIENEKLPFRDISICAAAYRQNKEVTVHVGLGYDIIHQHPNFDPSACGKASYTDFLKFAAILERIENGVVMNFGSAIMGPEIYLKALSMARNIAHQEGRTLSKFTTLVCDLADLPNDFSVEAPKNCPSYYFRPWKTMLIRTVADGGKSYYVKGDHRETIPQLWTCLQRVT